MKIKLDQSDDPMPPIRNAVDLTGEPSPDHCAESKAEGSVLGESVSALTSQSDPVTGLRNALGTALARADINSDAIYRMAPVAQDITEIKHASDALKKSEQRLALATRSAGIGIWDWDIKTSELHWDEQMYQLYGVRAQDFSGAYDAWRNCVHPDDRERIDAETEIALAQENEYHSEFRVTWPNGEVHEIETHAAVQRNDEGVAIQMTGVNWDISERMRSMRELERSERRFNGMIATAMDAILTVDPAGHIVLFNSAAEHIFGYSAAEVRGKPLELLLPERFRAEHVRDVNRFAEHGQTMRKMGAFSVLYGLRKSGAEFPVEVSISRDRSDGQMTVTAILRDISVRRGQELKIARLNRVQAVTRGVMSAMLRLRDCEEMLQEACRVCVKDGVFPLVWVVKIDPATQVSEISAFDSHDPASISFVKDALAKVAVEDLPSYRAARSARPAIINDMSCIASFAPIAGELDRYGVSSCAAFPLIVDRHVTSVMIFLARETGFFDDEEIALLTSLTDDIVYALGSIENAQRLDRLAYYDALTGVANTSLFHDRLAQYVFAARQNAGTVCVIAFELEHFTRINDSLGRAVGDNLLRAVSERLGQHLVEPYALGRIGADTFAVASPRDGKLVASELRDELFEAFKPPFHIDGHEIHVCAQAGIAFFPNDGVDASSVFKNAEAALMLAKSSGNRYAYYSKEIHARIELRLTLEKELRAAILTQQFVLHYQSRVDMNSGEVVGAEALLRWQHPERGLISPAEFIAFAEETGLIVPIGAWVIGEVCAKQSAWIAAGIAAVPIAVNVSSVQLEKGDLVQTVRDALQSHSLAAKHLELELTESAIMADPIASAQVLHKLHALGLHLALDDFGTGYSSLAHLKRFPFDAVKIDQSFIADITNRPDDAAIVDAIIAMAHSLGLNVIAEGVETEGQFNYLRMKGCDQMQGFHFGPAVSKEEFEVQLRSDQHMLLPAATPSTQRTLLLVDDEPGILAALKRSLRRDGYHILTAGSGPEALEMLAVHPAQVIISDQRMPKMSGTEFLSIVKQLYPDSMRIILSGYTDLQVVTDSVNRGAVFKFLTKPWDDGLLRDQVRDAFQRHWALS